MGKIVVNKHFDNKSQITPDKFIHKGELIISNQVGYEGIFIKNNNGEIFYIGPTKGTGTDVPLEYKEYIESFINGRLEGYITQEEFNELIKDVQIDPSQVRVIANEEITSALTVYSTTEEVNAAIEQAVSAIKIPSLEGYATKDDIKDFVTSGWVESQGFLTEHQDITGKQDVIEDLDAIRSGASLGATALQEIPTEAMRQVAAEEIVKIVNSADSRYDTLKEISDWILSDTTGAASMANDITYLKAISADTRLTIIESGLTNVETKISGLTSEDIYDKDSNKTQAEINQMVLQGGSESSKHFFMSTEEYATLLADGKVTIDGTEIVYDENAFYALYEAEEQ
ncbi:MAG: hypothetical protein J6J23_00935 [Clostridia bacterium]|nr:hypothetical protein [Clostridia bacterium]